MTDLASLNSETKIMATQASCTASPEVENAVNSANPLKTLPTKPKKRLVRRVQRDLSAIYRRSLQGAFLLLNLWIGVQFYSWVRHFELGLGPSQVGRLAGAEGWLPIAGLMNLKYWLLSG